MRPIKRIVVGTDFSECADLALDGAVDLAAQVGAAITLVHAYEPPLALGFSDSALLTDAQFDEMVAVEAHSQLALAVERRRSRGIDIEFVLRTGLPWEKLHNVAVDVGADLIVVGAHGHRGFSRSVFGSVAERVIRTASRRVLVIPCGRPAGDAAS
jgi:nucleotide-binding universal stress UspA family protein